MSLTIQLQTTVLPGHRIDIRSPEFPVGHTATVHVLVDQAELPKRRLSEILTDYQGGGLFRTTVEVDAYLRAEREWWDK